jgi:hypothetical protein
MNAPFEKRARFFCPRGVPKRGIRSVAFDLPFQVKIKRAPLPSTAMQSHNPPKMQRSATGGKKRNRLLIFLLPVALTLAGCAALERAQMRPTEVYYIASSTEQFAPKPKEFTPPVLSSPPRSAKPIGVFQYTTESGRSFAIKSAIYNGRRVGADAIWLRNIQEWSEPYAYDVPAHFENYWETRQERRIVREKGRPGEPDRVREEYYPVTSLVQRWVPTRHYSGFHHFTAIDAQMFRTP